jgi:tRNA1(Val) A37 N6-methylase TrmN6
MADVKSQSVTTDAFLDGRLSIAQPAKGFRAGLDSVLLGAAVGAGAGTLLDLGCGAGVAGLVALTHHAGLNAVLVDSDAAMLALARRNVDANGFAGRARVIAADITARGGVRAASGLTPGGFDVVIANPPFYDPADVTVSRSAPGAHAHDAEALDAWIRTAAACLKPGGEVVFIHRAAELPAVLAGFDRRFGAIAVLPLAPYPGAAASRVLVRGVKGARAPLALLAPRAVHEEKGGAFSPGVDAVLRGRAVLDWQSPGQDPR